MTAKMKVLVSTCAVRDLAKVNAARRALPYDQLVLVCGEPDAEEIRALAASERIAHPAPEIVAVDPFDLPGCLAATLAVIRRWQGEGHEGPGPARPVELRVNVSGGPKPLSMGALLACLTTGTEAYHCEPGEARGCAGPCCDDQAIQLPAIRGLAIGDLFPAEVRRVVAHLRGSATVAELATRSKVPADDVHRALSGLWNQHLVEVTGEFPPHRYRWTPHGQVIRGEILRRGAGRVRRT